MAARKSHLIYENTVYQGDISSVGWLVFFVVTPDGY